MRILLPWLAAVLTACSGATECTEIAVAGLRVKVNDEKGAPVCDATVTAHDGTFTTPLEPVNCAYLGAWERVGTYAIDVTRKDDKPASLADITVVKADECHVRTAEVVVTLTPE